MVVDSDIIQRDVSYPISTTETEYKPHPDITLRLKEPFVAHCRALEEKKDLTGVDGTIEQVRTIAIPGDFDVPDDADTRVLARMVHDFLLLQNGISRRPSSS